MFHRTSPRRTRAALRKSLRRVARVERLDERRVLSSIHGIVFEDVDSSLRQEAVEAGLEDRVVYVDLNNDEHPSIGEPLQRTDAAGNFTFDDLPAGEYVVRWFNGAATQAQTTPRAGHVEGGLIELDGAKLVRFAGDDAAVAIDADGRAVRVSLLDGTQSAVELPAEATDLSVMPDGRAVVLLKPGEGTPDAVVVDFEAGDAAAAEFELADGETGWAAVAIDASGNGLLIPGGSDTVNLRALQSAGGPASSATSFSVSDDAVVTAGLRPGPLVIAEPESGGTRVTFWDTEAGEPVAEGQWLADLADVLAFDPPSGLLLGRETGGDVVVMDVSADFQVVRRFAGQDQPVVLDGLRQQVAGIDPDSGELFVHDLIEDAEVDRLAIPGGAVLGMALGPAGNRLVVHQSDGLRRIRLDRPTGHRVRLENEAETPEVRFGVRVLGEDNAPEREGELAYATDEDEQLVAPAPSLLHGAIDADSDSLIVIPVSDPASGTVVVSPAGGLTYTPNENYYGEDTFQIILHDGHEASEPIDVVISVDAVNDPPEEMVIDIDPVGETTEGGDVIGELLILDPDDDADYHITVSDPRIMVIDGLILLAPDVQLDFEVEPRIDVVIEAVDRSDSEIRIEQEVEIEVADENDPIEAVSPESASIAENLAGAVIATLEVTDQDADEQHMIQVNNDSRFSVVGNVLRLADGVSLNYEDEREVVLDLLVTGEAGDTFNSSMVLTVEDRNDPPEGAMLIDNPGHEVLENAPGYSVGRLSVYDEDVDSTFEITVDDPRFEVREDELKLRDGTVVRLKDQEEIRLQLTITDVGEPTHTITSDMVLIVGANSSPWHNSDQPTDVDGDGSVQPRDALIIINILNGDGPGVLDPPSGGGSGEGGIYVDVNGDGMITPLDALLVINELNRRPRLSEPAAPDEAQPMLPSPEGEAPAGGRREALVRETSPAESISPTAERVAVARVAQTDAAVRDFERIESRDEQVEEELLSTLAVERPLERYRVG